MRYNVAFAAALCSMTLLLASGAPWPRKRETVWPLLLEERSAGEELIVMVTRDIVLRLQRASPLAKNVRVVRMFDVANLTSHPEDIQIESREVYEHAESSTVLLITTEKGLRIKGVINNNIRVSYDDNQEIKNGEPVPHFLDIIHHLVGSATWVNDASGDYDLTHPMKWNAILRERSDTGEIIHKEQNSTSPKKVTVETTVVVTTKYAAAFKVHNTRGLKDIVDYLQVFIALVNLAFKTFNTKVLDVQLTITSVLLLSKLKETFLRKIPGHEDIIDRSSYNEFLVFMAKKEVLFGHADVVLLITSDSFGSLLPDGKVISGPIGMAAAGGACTTSRAAMISEQPLTLTGVLTATHEISHLLGCVHDGQPAPHYLTRSPGAQSCSNNARHIMSTYRESKLVATFSSCSQAQVLAFLGEPWADCLSNEVRRHRINVDALKFEYSLHDRNGLCRELHPRSSNITFLPAYNGYDITKCDLLCEETTGEKKIYRHDAPEFTLCDKSENGSPMVCLQKKCTSSVSKLRTFQKSKLTRSK
ncbi:venom metalloproteinase BumaMPs1 isoform X2 [Rhipicephalus microplus]